MSESNITLADQTHRILISSPKRAADRTVYNFISFKRYSSSLKSNQRNDYLSTGPIETFEEQTSITITNRLVSDL